MIDKFLFRRLFLFASLLSWFPSLECLINSLQPFKARTILESLSVIREPKWIPSIFILSSPLLAIQFKEQPHRNWIFVIFTYLLIIVYLSFLDVESPDNLLSNTLRIFSSEDYNLLLIFDDFNNNRFWIRVYIYIAIFIVHLSYSQFASYLLKLIVSVSLDQEEDGESILANHDHRQHQHQHQQKGMSAS